MSRLCKLFWSCVLSPKGRKKKGIKQKDMIFIAFLWAFSKGMIIGGFEGKREVSQMLILLSMALVSFSV